MASVHILSPSAMIIRSQPLAISAREWHSNLSYTLIFACGRDESQIEIFSMVNSQATISLIYTIKLVKQNFSNKSHNCKINDNVKILTVDEGSEYRIFWSATPWPYNAMQLNKQSS